MSQSSLSRAIFEEDWKKVVKLTKTFDDMARQWSTRDGFFDGKTSARVLPLHEALVNNAPYAVIKALVRSYPKALTKTESSYQRLPLHCACRKNANPKVIRLLVGQSSAACMAPDSLERLPIHYALTNGANAEVLDILMSAAPDSAKGYDKFGWTPVHVALNVDAPVPVVERLLESNPQAVLIRTGRGASISKCIPKGCSHRQVLQELVQETKQEVAETVHLPSLRKNSLRASRLTMV
mmetsp:Transcript_1189/g.3334  ORF Transcript_1189/g.3334 Transcript_1189/m.3334 type:complete len:238 (+) Transcript_1189:170-883(+)